MSNSDISNIYKSLIIFLKKKKKKKKKKKNKKKINLINTFIFIEIKL